MCTNPGCRGCVPVTMPDGQTTYYCPAIRVTLLCTVRRVDPKPNCPGVDARPPKPKGVTPQKPEKEPKPKKVRTPKPTATQRPRLIPSAPRISVGSGLGLLGTLAMLGFALVVLGFVVSTAVAVGAWVAWFMSTVLPWLLVSVIGGGVTFAVWSTRDADAWQVVPVWLARRREARAVLEERRAEWAALVEADSAPIALGPATPVDTVTAAEHDELARRWMPGTHVPDVAPEWRR